MIWPDLVLSKIYWYLWKHNIQLVNKYYTHVYRASVFSSLSIYSNVSDCYINYRDLSLINRYMSDTYITYIHNFCIGDERCHHMVPKNYIFSSGLNSPDGYK
jgi:hypothetical protein